jgi:hypothetical protein
MEETANASVEGSDSRVEAKNAIGRHTTIVSLALAAFLVVAAGWFEYGNTFRNERYQIGAGVQYPWWNEIILSSSRSMLDGYTYDCEGASPDHVFCAMLAKVGTSQQSSNEVAVIKQVISQDRSSSYCDEFFGPCALQPSNVTISDASRVFEYLNAVYLEPAREDIARGRLARAQSAIARIDYLLAQVDLPLGTGGCCYNSDPLYIAPAFLSDRRAWRDRQFVQQAIDLADGGGRESGYPAIAAYARGLDAGGRGCFRTAAAEFARLGLSDSGRRIRELGSYMALLSDFRAKIQGEGQCAESQPAALTPAQRGTLKAQVTRRGFLTDIAQIDASPASGGGGDAS